MSDAGQANSNDERVSNTNGTLTIVKLGDDEKRALRWISPLLIFVGFNLAVSVFLLFEWQHAATNYSLVYSHQIKEEAYLAQHGVRVDQFGDPLPQP